MFDWIKRVWWGHSLNLIAGSFAYRICSPETCFCPWTSTTHLFNLDVEGRGLCRTVQHTLPLAFSSCRWTPTSWCVLGSVSLRALKWLDPNEGWTEAPVICSLVGKRRGLRKEASRISAPSLCAGLQVEWMIAGLQCSGARKTKGRGSWWASILNRFCLNNL